MLGEERQGNYGPTDEEELKKELEEQAKKDQEQSEDLEEDKEKEL
jgi:hypothetical protein